MNQDIAQEFVEQIIYRLDESTRMIELSFDQLSEEDIWKKPNRHLHGNITQYAVASLGRKEDVRNRDEEFMAKGGVRKSELLNMLRDTIDLAKGILSEISVDELLRKREVQGFTFSGIGIAIHVTEHYSYHTGQIAFWTKQLTNKENLGFYDGFDLNIKNNDK